MAMRFPYRQGNAPGPIWVLRRRLYYPRPIIAVTVIGPTGTVYQRSLLDTGADYTVFPESVAEDIGLDLSQSPSSTAYGVGAVNPVRFGEVTLRIARAGEQREWKARVGFTSARLRFPLLGFGGFLEFFAALFEGDHEEVELTINGIYPGI